MRTDPLKQKKQFTDPRLVVYGDFATITKTLGMKDMGDNAAMDNNMRT